MLVRLVRVKLNERRNRQRADLATAIGRAVTRREEIETSPAAASKDGRVSESALAAAVSRQLELNELKNAMRGMEARAAKLEPSTGIVAFAKARLWNLAGFGEWVVSKAAIGLALAWAVQHPQYMGAAASKAAAVVQWFLRVTA